MRKVISFDNNPELDANVPSLINVDFFTNGKSDSVDVDFVPVEDKKKPKRGRPVGSKNVVDGKQLLKGDTDDTLPMYQSNEPYLETYSETTNMLKTSVCQIDLLQSEVKHELDLIRGSKTLKRKYDYMSNLTATMASLIGTKMTAIREINKTITDCHNLEMKRIKDLKLDSAGQDDNKSTMDLYSAYISAPGTYNGPTGYNAPNVSDLTLLNSAVSGVDMYQGYNPNYQVDDSVNRMILQDDPSVKTVIKYNSNTGERFFDVINTTTGESLKHVVPPPDPMFLNDITIDTRNGIGRNVNMDTSYQIVEIGNDNMNKY